MREANVTIHGRKIKGYPSMTFRLKFNSIEELLEKIDKAIDETDYGKVDAYVEDEDQFSIEEMNSLEKEWIIFN